MKISVIVPVYNCSKYIKRLIESILMQDYDNYEIILVDDGSTDSSWSVINHYSNNSKIFAYKKENEGPGLTRKYGFLKSTGDLLFFIDSDDWLPKGAFSKIINIFNTFDVDVVFFDRTFYCNEKVIEYQCQFNDLKIKDGILNKKLFESVNVRGGLGTKVFKSKLMGSNYFIDANSYEDFVTTYCYLDQCKTFYYLNESLYNVNRDSDNISLTTSNTLEKIVKSCDILLDTYNNLKSKELKKSLAYVLQERLCSLLIYYLRSKNKKEIKNKVKEYSRKLLSVLDKYEKKEMQKNCSLKRKIVCNIFLKLI